MNFIKKVNEYNATYYSREIINAKIKELIKAKLITQSDINDYLKKYGYRSINYCGLAHVIKEKRNLRSDIDIYKKYLGIDAKNTGLSIEKVIGFISQAGGISVLSHPVRLTDSGKTKEILDKAEKLINKYRIVEYDGKKALGLRGLEAYHWKHAAKQMTTLRELIENLNKTEEYRDYPLIWTIGSDSHDKETDLTKMGVGANNIPAEASVGFIKKLDGQFERARKFNEENINAPGIIITGTALSLTAILLYFTVMIVIKLLML